MVLVMGIGTVFILGGFAAYFQFSHVRDRVNRFIDPQNSDAYQVSQSLEAFKKGGVFGRGPGEGHVKENLPVYARPVFIRILEDLPTTSTHKMQKNKLKEEAFNINEISETVLVKKPGEQEYSRLDSDFYSMIMDGRAGF